jgi:hypothetical protein
MLRRLGLRRAAAAGQAPPGSGMDADGVNDVFAVAEVRAIYEARLGPPSREARFEDRHFSVEILKWTKGESTGDAFVYLTLGASRISLGGHRVEYCIGFDDEHDDIATVLAEFAAQPVRNGNPVDEGQTVTLPSPLWKGSRFRTLLVFRSALPVIPDATLSDGSHFTMRGLAPLHDSELAAKKRIGYEALWAQFAAARVPLSDAYRRPATLREP